MITLAGVAIQSQIYESSASLMYWGVRVQDNCALPGRRVPRKQAVRVCVVKESIARWEQQHPKSSRPMPLSRFLQFEIDITRILGSIHNANESSS
jgi:hypothetical protein